MTFDGDTTPRFTTGTVIRAGLAVVSHNFFRFCGIVLAVGIPAAILIGLGGLMLASGTAAGGLSGSFRFDDRGHVLLFLVLLGILSAAAYFLIQAAVTYGTLQTLRGRSVSVGACLSEGFSALPRIFLAGLVLFFVGLLVAVVASLVVGALAGGRPWVESGTLFGLMSLLLLGVTLTILTLVWVFLPAVVVERLGPVACFARSLALTKGRRWPVAGVVLLVFLANFVATAITKLLMQSGAPLGGAVLNLLVGLFFMVLSGVLSAVGYFLLRAEKEGVGIDDVARVFD